MSERAATTPADARGALASVAAMAEAAERRGAWPAWASLLLALCFGTYTGILARFGEAGPGLVLELSILPVFIAGAVFLVWLGRKRGARVPASVNRLTSAVVTNGFFWGAIDARKMLLGGTASVMAGVVAAALVLLVWFACDAATLPHARRGVWSARWRFALALLIATVVAAQALPLDPVGALDHRMMATVIAVIALVALIVSTGAAIKAQNIQVLASRAVLYVFAGLAVAIAWRDVLVERLIAFDRAVRDDVPMFWDQFAVRDPDSPLGFRGAYVPAPPWEPTVDWRFFAIAAGVGIAVFLALTLYARVVGRGGAGAATPGGGR